MKILLLNLDLESENTPCTKFEQDQANILANMQVNENSSDQYSTKKTKVDNVLKNNTEDENTEREEEGIMHDFDYHDTINTESYENYLQTFKVK